MFRGALAGVCRWRCARVLALPCGARVCDRGRGLRLRHHRDSDAERQRLLGGRARVSRPGVIFSGSRSARLHPVARPWRESRSRLAMITVPHGRQVAQARGPQRERGPARRGVCHAQTCGVLTHTGAARGVVGRGEAAGRVQARSQPRSGPGRWRPWSRQGCRRGPCCAGASTREGGLGT